MIIMPNFTGSNGMIFSISRTKQRAYQIGIEFILQIAFCLIKSHIPAMKCSLVQQYMAVWYYLDKIYINFLGWGAALVTNAGDLSTVKISQNESFYLSASAALLRRVVRSYRSGWSNNPKLEDYKMWRLNLARLVELWEL
jgi:hypothetical protein